jgi:sodium/bile acid cotransporter 7
MIFTTSQVPFSISRFIAAGIGVSVPTKELFRSMVITLLIPLILGKVNLLIVFVDPSNYNLCDI